MEKPSVVSAVNKLAIAGQQAGFSLEQMIELLNSGLSVLTLLDLISWRLSGAQVPPALSCRGPLSLVREWSSGGITERLNSLRRMSSELN
jgi:hypothetical protein